MMIKNIFFNSPGEEEEAGAGRNKEEEEEEGAQGEEGRRKKRPPLFSWAGVRDSVMAVVKRRGGNQRSVIVIALVGLTVNQCLKVSAPRSVSQGQCLRGSVSHSQCLKVSAPKSVPQGQCLRGSVS